MVKTKAPWARVIALVMSLVMALSLTTLGAVADGTTGTPITTGEETASVTIIGRQKDKNQTIKLYKLIDVNWTTVGESMVQPQNPVYTWNDNTEYGEKTVADWLMPGITGLFSHYIEDAESNAVTDAYMNASASNLQYLFEKMLGDMRLRDWDLIPVKTLNTGDNTSVTVDGLEMGQYLLELTGTGSYTSIPAVVNLYPTWDEGTNQWVLNNTSVTIKGDQGPVYKEADNTNVNIGDTVTYTVSTLVPTYPSDAPYKAFNMGDTMGTGLTWDGADSLSVCWSDDGVVDEAVKAQVVTNIADYYSVKTAGETKKEGATFEVQFNYDNLIDDYSAAKYIHLIYTATINEDAFQEETEFGIMNTAYTGVHNDPYDNGSYDDDTQKIEEVFTYGITVNKVKEDGTTPLPGAEFKLYRDVSCQTEVKFNGSNGVYKYDAGQDAPSVALATDGSGQLKLQGLAYGTYYLKETKAPNGYALPGDVVTITITDSDKDGNLDVTTATGSMVVQEAGTYAIGEPGDDPLDNIFSFKVKNEKPDFTLPTTGGMGTVAFTIGGVILMACGAALVLFAVKKFKAEG